MALTEQIDTNAIQLLVLNSGSSSLKFASYGFQPDQRVLFSGRLIGIGEAEGHFRATTPDRTLMDEPVQLPDQTTALAALLPWLAHQPGVAITGVGHRLVHGGIAYRKPQRVTPDVLAALTELTALAPSHLPTELA